MQTNPALMGLFMKEFQWCKVRPGESAAIVTDPESPQHYLALAFDALCAMEARPFQVMLPVHPEPEELPVVGRGTGGSSILAAYPGVVDLLGRTGFIVDLTTEGLIHAPEMQGVLKSGARFLFIREPADALARLIPTEERVRRIERGVQMLEAAKEMKVTSAAGTRLRVDLRGAAITGARGYCDRPGRWANWGQGNVAAMPPSLEIEGDVVLAPGDIVFPLKKFVEREVLFRFERGFVEAIEGEGTDADLIRDYMERFNDRVVYGMSHVGWGLHEKALWHALSFYEKNEFIGCDGRAFEGNFMFSTGPNYPANRHTLCHFDIPMRHCSLSLDGRPVLDAGRIVEPSLMRAACEEVPT